MPKLQNSPSSLHQQEMDGKTETLKLNQYFILQNQPGLWTFLSIQCMALLAAILSQLAALKASWVTAHFWGFHSRSASHLCCLCSLVSQTHNCTRLTPPVLKAAVKSAKVKWHGNVVSDTAIAYVINAEAQTNQQTHRCRKCKVILEPASSTLHMRPTGSNTNCYIGGITYGYVS